MTVLEAIQRSTNFLESKGVESARLHAELLLADVLKLPRMQLYLNFERQLSNADIETYREFIRRRATREPLQHIIGTANFCGLELKVNSLVLVPRPETELLAERGWQFLSALSSQGTQQPTALDLGTGSGCIAIALAKNAIAAKIHAVDVSSEAIAIARENAEAHGVSDRVDFSHGDALDVLESCGQIDLIITNPPYIPSAEISELAPEVQSFEPPLALDGGPEGLDFFRDFAAHARSHLRAHGKFMAEFGDGQEPALRQIFAAQNWVVEDMQRDYTGRPRILVASRRSPG